MYRDSSSVNGDLVLPPQYSDAVVLTEVKNIKGFTQFVNQSGIFYDNMLTASLCKPISPKTAECSLIRINNVIHKTPELILECPNYFILYIVSMIYHNKVHRESIFNTFKRILKILKEPPMEYFEHIICLFLFSTGPETTMKIINIFAPKYQFFNALVKLEKIAAKSFSVDLPNFIALLVLSHKFNDIERGQISQFAFSTIENGTRFPKSWETVLKSLNVLSAPIKIKSKSQVDAEKLTSLIEDLSNHKDDTEDYLVTNARDFRRVNKCNDKLFYSIIDTMTKSKDDINKTKLLSIIQQINKISDVDQMISLYKSLNERTLLTLESAEVCFQDFLVQRASDVKSKEIGATISELTGSISKDSIIYMFDDLQKWETAYSATVRIWNAIREHRAVAFPQILENYQNLGQSARCFLCSAMRTMYVENPINVPGLDALIQKLLKTVKDPRLHDAVISDANEYTHSASLIIEQSPRRQRRITGSSSGPITARRLNSFSSVSSLPFV